jgi:hypothetical protein
MLPFAAPSTGARKEPGFTLLHRLPSISAGVVTAISLLVLAGWALNLPVLRSLHPSWPAMPLATAVALVLVAISFAAIRILNLAARSIIGYGFSIPVLVLGLLGSGEYINGGQMLPASPSQVIAPSTTVNFILVAGALLLQHRGSTKG